MKEKVIIMGAAGRDFHNFNVYFRNNPQYAVVAFTATQIPNIHGRRYPAELAGEGYPEGIAIYPESELGDLIRSLAVDLVVFSYSDIAHVDVMHKASAVTAAGANFSLLGATRTMLPSSKPVVAVCAVRTGCGKSQTTRQICSLLASRGLRPVVVRHPMPYGDLKRQEVQRFASYADFATHECTIEEREEYEPIVDRGWVVYAGVDYEKILRQAEQEADVVIWDGGNNDTPFFRPNVHIAILDPHRPGHECLYFPGETNLVMADVAVINKVDSATTENVELVRDSIRRLNPAADVVLAASAITADDSDRIAGQRVLVVEDGPTLTHGGMTLGAGLLAAQRFGAAAVVDPKAFAVGSILEVFNTYPHVSQVLPAMGYGPRQIAELEETIKRCDCDLVVFATPIDLPKLLKIDKPSVRIRYEYQDHSQPHLADVLFRRLAI